MFYNQGMEKIINNVPALLAESNCKPTALGLVGISQGTAYAWANNTVTRCDFDTVARLCGFFTDRLGRPVGVGDILSVYVPAPEPE